jgi:hypothetical protein
MQPPGAYRDIPRALRVIGGDTSSDDYAALHRMAMRKQSHGRQRSNGIRMATFDLSI